MRRTCFTNHSCQLAPLEDAFQEIGPLQDHNAMCLDADVPWSMTSVPPQFASPSTTFHFLHTTNSQCSPAKGHNTVGILLASFLQFDLGPDQSKRRPRSERKHCRERPVLLVEKPRMP